MSMRSNNRISKYDVLLNKNKNKLLFFYLLEKSNSIYIKFISFEFQSSHFLTVQHAEMILYRDVIIISFMNNIQFQSEDHQLMLLDQQWDKMQDNLIYEIEDFWENLHVINLKSEASLRLLCKQDLVISRSHDLEISWLTVMWPESW